MHGLDPWEESKDAHELVKARNVPCLGMVPFTRELLGSFSCTFGPNRTQTLPKRYGIRTCFTCSCGEGTAGAEV